MKNMNIKKIFGLSLLLIALLSSCNGMWDEEGKDCTTHKRLHFTYDWNMLYADAFSHEVKTLKVYAFDNDGNVVWTRTAAADSIVANGGYMNVDDMPSGVYHFQVWAEGEQRYANSYVFDDLGTGTSARSGLTAALPEALSSSSAGSDASSSAVSAGDAGVAITPVTHDLTPLYYGASGVYGTAATADFTDIPLGGTREATINLMKNTENFRIVLQNLNGKALDPSEFHFEIRDDNGSMDADNNVLTTGDSLAYNAWSVESGEAGIVDNETHGTTITGVSAIVAELTTNHLVKGHDMRLHVTRISDGKEIINIPVIDMCLLVKGNYNQNMTDQEYLDRQDTWNFIFFLDANRNWLSTSIYIQQWRIVLQNVVL